MLGRGGFGLTYQARRAGVAGDMVAIKELYPHASARRAQDMSVIALPGADALQIRETIGMFLREARVICNLDHPNIVRGVDAFEGNNTGYLVMRYVSGRSLRDSLRDPSGYRPSPQALPALLSPLLDALDTLHRHNLLHCDIKPDNIFLGVGYEPILIDLGSARLNKPGEGVEEAATYSSYFSAIEQITDRFGPIGPWTDIYQLCAVLYRCITGGKLPDAVDRANPAGDSFLPLAEIPEVVRAYPQALIGAIDHGLRLHPRHRPQTVAEWRRPFESLLPRPSAVKRAPPQPPPATPVTPPRSIEPAQPPSHVALDDIAEGAAHSTKSSPDVLIWLGGALLVLILVIIWKLVYSS